MIKGGSAEGSHIVCCAQSFPSQENMFKPKVTVNFKMLMSLSVCHCMYFGEGLTNLSSVQSFMSYVTSKICLN